MSGLKVLESHLVVFEKCKKVTWSSYKGVGKC